MTTLTVRTRMTSNAAGASQIILKWDGKQKTVPTDQRAPIGDKHQSALRNIFPGSTVEILKSQMNSPAHTFLTHYWTVTQ